MHQALYRAGLSHMGTNFKPTKLPRDTHTGIPLKTGYRCYYLWITRTRMMQLPGRERSLTISSVVWIQSTNMIDRQTDRHRPIANTALTHSVVR